MGINKGILEPCPYCGGKAKLKSALDMVNWVKCSVCSAESGNYCTEKEAVDIWNKVAEKCQDEGAKFELQQILDRKSYLLSRQNKAYNDFCEQNGLRKQSERLQIAHWQREQAAKARGAARRYQNAKTSTAI